jgi:hypothetical protein
VTSPRSSCVVGIVVSLLVEMALEGIEARGPEVAVPLQPAVKLPQGVGPQPVDALLALDPRLREARLTEHAEVSRHCWASDGEAGCDVARRPVTVAEEVDDLAARGIGESGEGVHHAMSVTRGLRMSSVT